MRPLIGCAFPLTFALAAQPGIAIVGAALVVAHDAIQ